MQHNDILQIDQSIIGPDDSISLSWLKFLNKSKHFVKLVQLAGDVSKWSPKPELLLSPLRKLPINRIRVILIGESPYKQVDKATGLCFSLPKNTKVANTSMKNILAAIGDDIDDSNSDISHWADQGVLMINVQWVISPEYVDWSPFTIELINYVRSVSSGTIAFMLFGKKAQSIADKCSIPEDERYEWSHPSPMNTINNDPSDARHFSHCDVFDRINEWLYPRNIVWKHVNSITLFTDGGCKANGKSNAKSTYAYAGFDTTTKELLFHYGTSSSGEKQSNNVGELSAILYGIRYALRCGCQHIKIITDSQYSIKCITEWGPNWRIKNLRDKANTDLIYPIIDMLNNTSVKWEFLHVRGHKKAPSEDSSSEAYFNWYGNDFVDKLCNEAAIND